MEENELIPVDNNNAVEYTDDNIRHLSDMEHVRTRPGMYIGRLGDGAHAEDGIYVLLKEVIDNSIDEFKMQSGKKTAPYAVKARDRHSDHTDRSLRVYPTTVGFPVVPEDA